MVAPLMDLEKKEMIGLLYLTSPEKYYFDKRDLIHLEGFAELVAMAIIQPVHSLNNISSRRKK
jgi:GAF domain-containing protein